MKNSLLGAMAGIVILSCSAAVLAADEVPLAQSAEAAVTASDLEAELSAVPPGRIADLKSHPDVAEKLVSDIHLRRRLAGYATQAGLADDPATLAKLKLLRERILADAYFRHMENKDVTAEKILKLAESEYRAQPERFQRDAEVHVRHILVKANECDEDRGRGKAEAIRERILAGESFEALAKELSQDPGSAQKGGDLGFVPRGRTVKPFEEAAFALKHAGDVSEVVESKFGFHLIKLEERRSAGTIPFEEAKAGLEREMEARLRTAARKKAMDAALAAGMPELDKAAIAAAVERLSQP